MKEKLLTYIEKADRVGIITFLKSLTPEERKALAPEIRKYDTYHDTWEKRQEEGVWGKIYTNRIAMFVCLPPAEAKKSLRWSMPTLEELDAILPWFCPKDFAEYPFIHEYEYLVKWEAAGYLTLTPEMVVSILPDVIFTKDEKGYKGVWTPEILESYPITLDKHIWWLFEYPSNIAWYSNNTAIGEANQSPSKCLWFDTFIKYTAEDRLDRMRVLRESLLAVNRNFNKVLTGWFTDLFAAMQPTEAELLALQTELFGTLTCIWSKPVTHTVKLLKKLAVHPQFHTEEFLSNLPLLLGSEVKAILTSTLSVVEVVLKRKKDFIPEIIAMLCTVFLSKDEAIQKKAAELFTQYASPGSESKALLAAYADNLLMNTRSLLADYLDKVEPPTPLSAEELLVELPSVIGEENRIPTLQSTEDFAFFLTQAVDSSEPYFFDHLLNNLVVWGNQVTKADLVLLEPAFKKVYSRLYKWGVPILDSIPYITMTDYAQYLIHKFPKKTKKLQTFRDKMDAVDKDRREQSNYYTKRQITLKDLSVEFIYTGFRQIAIEAIEKIKNQDALPLLSTPTHTPAWINPLTLIDRIAAYQQQGIEPGDMDMQLAIQRCVIDFPEEALIKARQSLTGELKHLFIFLLDKNAPIESPIEHPSWWMTAAITKRSAQPHPELEPYGYHTIPKAYITGELEWEEYIDTGYNGQYEWKHFRITNAEPQIQLKDNKLFYRYLWEADKISASHFFYDRDHKDWMLFPYLACPNNPDVFLGRITICFADCDMCEVPEQTLALLTARLVHELKRPFHEMHYMALACFLFAKVKAVQDYGFAIWSENMAANRLDPIRLGTALGKIEAMEAFPLKRLADCMSTYMIGVSHKHNQSLVVMLEALMQQLPQKPIKNLKKLLELYNELLALTQSRPNISGVPHWKSWGTEGSLKKVVKEISE
ncbi:DUF6493 family protein [Bacteroides sp. 224]|uniref:DUF6493 family protein n=1 Tax=Bacteroides sp. 224 TaxID=2302936 RepID=UPI0013D5D415|nr:DUF6493 family protein [Bacteroides sp. 224]